MNLYSADINGPETFPIHELDQIECAIQASINCLNALQERRDALTARLERITRPEPTVSKPHPIVFGPAYEYRGSMFKCWTAIDVFHDLLRRLWTEFPERRAAMADAVGQRGSTRTYVAMSPAELFPQRSLGWATRYSRPLVDGWYVDTNLSRERMRTLVPAAVAAAGLKWSEDVRVYWYSTEVGSRAA